MQVVVRPSNPARTRELVPNSAQGSDQAAETLGDLRIPPGNRLERLAGDHVGQYSLRVNDQWRICFRWSTAGAADVEIVDYR